MSTNTRRLLEDIGSADRFEALATDILRAAHRRYATLAHVGTNADGRAVRSPVDGIAIARTPTSRHLILAHHTITALKDLRAKWLDPKDGDVIKALRIARAEHNRKSVAGATLILTTPFEPNETLIRDANALAGGELQLDLWTGSRLAGFLDKDPEGQWIRAAYFETDQTRLSRSRLKAIGKQSFETLLAIEDPAMVVERQLDADLAAFSRRHSGVGFIVGGSGFGKSTAVRKLGIGELERGGFALVIPHEIAEQAPNIEQAVASTLRSYAPALDPTCGRDALGLASAGERLLLLVEDINRSANPIGLVERLLTWEPRQWPTGGEKAERHWQVLAPVWESNVAVAQKAREAVTSRSMLVDRFSRNEAAAAIIIRARHAGRTITPLQAEDLAARLGDDPLLIALNRDWHRPSMGGAITSYLDQETGDAAGPDLLQADIRHGLDRLVERIVLERRLDPAWQDIRQWLEDDASALGAVRALIARGRVIRLDQDRLAYRHDRLRDHLISSAIERLIARGEFTEDHWQDPYFAGLLGAALPRLDDANIQRTAALNPPAIFAALQDEALAPSQVERFVDLADAWIRSEAFSATAPDQQKFQALGFLARIDAPFVAALARPFPASFPRLEALIRNGSVRAAANYCASSEPGVQNRWRDRLIEHAVRRHPGFISDLADFLDNDPSEELLEGALNLAGEIGSPDLAPSLARRWAREKAEGRSITTGWLWAAIRCCAGHADALPDELCGLWASLPQKVPGKDRDRNPRWDIAGHSLPWGFRRHPDARAIAYLLGLTKRHRGLVHMLGSILSKVDAPDAVLWSIEQSARIARRVERTRGINLFRSDLERTWNPDHHGQALSEASRAAAKRIWSDRRRSSFSRRAAFGVWSQTPSKDEVRGLARLEFDPILADPALRARLLAGDRTAALLLAGRIRGAERPSYWWQYARKIGLAQLHDEVEDFMRTRRASPVEDPHAEADYLLSELLMDANDDFARAVLKDNWDQLQGSTYYLQAALYTADKELVALARGAIADLSDPAAAFEHIDMHWGLKSFGRRGLIDVRQLEVLEPFYALFGEMRLMSFFEAANELGALEWRRRHIDPYLAGSGRNLCAGSQDALFASLDSEVESYIKYSRSWFNVDWWLERREAELWSRADLFALIGAWATARGTSEAGSFLAEAVKYFGTRETLKLLDRLSDTVRTAIVADLEDAQFAVRARSLS